MVIGTWTQAGPGIRSDAKTTGSVGARDLGHQQAGRVTVGVVEPVARRRGSSTGRRRPAPADRSPPAARAARPRTTPGPGGGRDAPAPMPRARRRRTPSRTAASGSVSGSPGCSARPPAWSKCRWESTTTSMSAVGHADRRRGCSSRTWLRPRPRRSGPAARERRTRRRRPRAGRSGRDSSRTSSARRASGIRFRSSGSTQRSHTALGALPNIAPPSSRCELPSSGTMERTASVDPTSWAGSTGVLGDLLPVRARRSMGSDLGPLPVLGRLAMIGG